MIGDVLLLTDQHHRAARQLAERVRARSTGKLVVAIAGESGAGKSVVAHALARILKDEEHRAKILHLDDYFKTTPAERTPWRLEHGIEAVGDEEIDWPLVECHVEAFRRGDTEVTLPCIDLLTDQVDRLVTSFAELPVLIVEGLYALRAPADLKVLIDLTYHDTGQAQAVRGKEPQNRFRTQVLEREHRIVQSHRPMADLLITRDFDVIEAGG